MALPNGDLITTPFDPQMAYPSDRRMQVDTLNSRDSMSMFIRWEGMEVYVLETSKKYILQGGRSNEYWKESGTGTGTGGTTFVGQFPTADLLPTSGRSAGDYAFVGTGDDFVQYNWDNIANQWVMAEGQTDMASEFFHIGYKTPLRRPVIFPLFPKDVLVEESGDFVFAPETAVARFIFVGEVTAIRGIETAVADREIKLVNRTGSDIPLRDKASGIPIDSGFDFGGTDYTWVNGSEITLKGNGTYWQLAPNNQVAFSDHLDSVNAQVSVGSDGLEVITGVYDVHTKQQVELIEHIGTAPLLDGVMYLNLYGKVFRRVNVGPVNPEIYGYKGDGIADDTLAIQKAIDIVNAMGGGVVMFPESSIGLVYSQGSTQFQNAVTGNTLSHYYALKIKDNVKIDLNGSTIRLADNQNCAVLLNDKMLYDQGRNVHLQIINGIIDSNIGNQGIPTGSTLITGIFLVNASGVYLDQLKFINSGLRSLRLHGIDFLRAGYLHSDSSKGSAFALGTYSPSQAWEGRIRYSHIDTMIAENAMNTDASQGNSIASCAYHCSFNVIQANKCGGGIKFQDGCEYVTISKVIMQGASGDEITEFNYTNNSGLKIQGGAFLDNPPKYITVGEVVSEYGGGSGLYLDYCEDITVGSYIGNWNDGLGDRGDVWVNNCKRVHVGSIKSSNAGSLGVALRANGFGVTINEITVLNPASVGPDLSGIQLLGGEYFIGTAISVDDRETPKMTYGFDVAGTGSKGYLNFLSTAGYKTNPIRQNTPNFKISRTIINDVDTLKASILILDSLEIGNTLSGNNNVGITAKSFSNIAVYAESIEGTGVQAISNSSTASYGASRSGRGGYFLQNSSTTGNITSPVLDVRRLVNNNDGIIYGPLIFGNDQANTSGARNNPLVDLRWDNVTKFRINNKGFIDIGNVRENRVESATNPNLITLDRDKYLRFTGSTGTITIPTDTFSQDNELIGEIEGGAKTFVSGAGVTLRFPEGQGLTAPTGSRFIIKFKTDNDALVTIIKPYTSPNASTTQRGIIEQATDAETITGTDTERAVSPANLQAKLNALILSATATLDFPTIAAGETERLTATVTGAALLDPVLVSGPADIYNANNSTIDAWVSAANTVTVRVRNNGSGSIDPGSGNFKIKVFK